MRNKRKLPKVRPFISRSSTLSGITVVHECPILDALLHDIEPAQADPRSKQRREDNKKMREIQAHHRQGRNKHGRVGVRR